MSTTHRSSATVAGALTVAAALAFTASTASSQVIDKPDANLPAVQDTGIEADRSGHDGRIEVQLAQRSQDAMARGGGWEALASGLSLLHEGERPVEATVHYAVVDRDGNVLESRTSDPVKLDGGHSKVGAAKELDFLRESAGARSSVDGGIVAATVPAGAHSPGETYFPDGYFMPPTKFFPTDTFDERHTVTDPDNMDRVRKPAGEDSGEERKPRGPGVFTDSDERAAGINPGRFLVVTVVPNDPDARGQVEVRPLIVDLDAK